MKTHHLLTCLVVTLLVGPSLPPLHAAEVGVDISSHAPRDPNAIVRQIELNVTLKQYEKVFTEMEEAKLQDGLGPEESGLPKEKIAEWHDRRLRKMELLSRVSQELRARINNFINEANKEAQTLAKPDSEPEAKAEPKVSPWTKLSSAPLSRGKLPEFPLVKPEPKASRWTTLSSGPLSRGKLPEFPLVNPRR
jgi:hypothetical protein